MNSFNFCSLEGVKGLTLWTLVQILPLLQTGSMVLKSFPCSLGLSSPISKWRQQCYLPWQAATRRN